VQFGLFFLRLYAISMRVLGQKWLKKRMDIAYSSLVLAVLLFKTRCPHVDQPSEAPSQSSDKRGFGQKTFERSEFFCPPLGA
jgi:hypothetical protein